jgi:hypothetical protein
VKVEASVKPMSTTELALYSPDAENSSERISRCKQWWVRFISRCASSGCPKLGKLWPSWMHKSSGIYYEGRWYCGRTCLESALAHRVYTLLSTFQSEKPRSHRIPLGLLLVNRGAITPPQLREALRLQREAGQGKLGDWLRQTADLNVQQLTAALGQQWGCPVFPLENQARTLTWGELIPFPILNSAGAVPAYASSDGRVLHIAFEVRVDHTLLYAVEQMLQCRTFPCVASGTAVKSQLEQFRRLHSRTDTCFDTVREYREMTWTICNYAAELQARRIVLARTGSFVWVRFFRHESSRDLLFRILPDPVSSPAEHTASRAKVSSTHADGRKGALPAASIAL